MHILMTATATMRPQADVPVDGRFEFHAVHCLPTTVLPYYCLYQPARSIFHLTKVITANIHIYKHTHTNKQNG